MVGSGQASLNFMASQPRGIEGTFSSNNESHVIWEGDALELLKTVPSES